MKRLCVIVLSLAVVFVMCSCSVAEKIPEVITGIDKNASVEYDGMNYQCHITRLTDGVVSVGVNSPENLSGLMFRQADGKFSVSCDNLICKTDSVTLPETSFPFMIIKILSSASVKENLLYCSSENGSFKFTGNSDTGAYQLFTDKEGNITKICDDNTGLKVNFEKNK
ncbi:MAG: hypothetical protein PUG48_04330 [Clostridia bacterium]|nr:hypothetical protein [Clostridia bacterium]